MKILVFATNITNESQVGRVNSLLTGFSEVADWNFDLDDCDKILRVVTFSASPRHIETLLQSEGLLCAELPD